MTEIVKRLKLWGVNQLYVVGGNGGNAAANAIQKECEVQSVVASVVGIPKSIDNDILLVRAQSIPAFRSRDHFASIVGIPKSIDNDILLAGFQPCKRCLYLARAQIDKCFGFETSVERSQGALMAAKVEARSTRRGIGLVKLMGRSSGFIAMQASMASGALILDFRV